MLANYEQDIYCSLLHESLSRMKVEVKKKKLYKFIADL